MEWRPTVIVLEGVQCEGTLMYVKERNFVIMRDGQTLNQLELGLYYLFGFISNTVFRYTCTVVTMIYLYTIVHF